MRYCLLILSLLWSLRTFDQRPGELDTTFRVRTNYGPNQWPLATFPSNDGGLLLYSPHTLFSGKKTGAIFKVLPNGDLDPSFQSTPTIIIGYSGFWCGNDGPPPGVPPFSLISAPDGSVYFTSPEAAIATGGGATNHGNVAHFLTDGQIDITFSFPDLYMRSLAFTPDSKLLTFVYPSIWTGGFMQRLFPNGKVDTSFQWNEPAKYLAGLVSGPGLETVAMFRKDTTYHFQKYDHNQNRFSSPYGHSSVHYNASNPEYRALVGIDRNGNLYEQSGSVPGYPNKILIRKRKPDAGPDPSFSPIILRYSNWKVEVNTFGSIVASSENEKYVYRYDSSGHFVDSVEVNHYRHQFYANNTLTDVGPDAHNRWNFVRKDMTGTVLADRSTRYGFDAPVTQLLQEPDGKLVVAGQFREYDEQPFPALARILPNGLPDLDFAVPDFVNAGPALPVLLEKFPNGDYLVITSRRYGKRNRFLHRIRPDGTTDTTFAPADLAVFSHPVGEVVKATRSSSGKIWLTLIFTTGPDSLYQSLVRLMPNSQKDPGFNPIRVHAYIGDYAQVVEMKCHRPDTAFISLQYWVSVGPTPDFIPTVRLLKIADADNSGSVQTILQKSWLNYYGDTDVSLLWRTLPMAGNLLVNLTGSIDRIKTNGGVLQHYTESGYVTGITGDDEIVSYHPTLQSNYWDWGLSKMTRDGLKDTLFETREVVGNPTLLLQPDTTHLYLAGSLVQYGDRDVRFLCRIHNRKSDMVLANEPAMVAGQNPLVYPNPASGEIRMKGFANKVHFYQPNGALWKTIVPAEGAVESTQSWPAGMYYWRSIDSTGKPVTGKWVKY